jgi:hypothetical protein
MKGQTVSSVERRFSGSGALSSMGASSISPEPRRFMAPSAWQPWPQAQQRTSSEPGLTLTGQCLLEGPSQLAPSAGLLPAKKLLKVDRRQPEHSTLADALSERLHRWGCLLMWLCSQQALRAEPCYCYLKRSLLDGDSASSMGCSTTVK